MLNGPSLTWRTYSEATDTIRYQKCLRHPDKVLTLQVNQKTGQYIPWCIQCSYEGYKSPALGKDDVVGERMWDMIQQQMARQPDQAMIPLVKEDIKQWLAPQASDQELEIFIRFCKGQGLNPFIGDVYLIPFVDRQASDKAGHTVYRHSIIRSLQWYLKVASRNPLYESYESGCIVIRNKEYINIIGTALRAEDTLFGGWCKVWKKGAARPFPHEVALADWDKGRDLWKDKANVMIEVTAIRQCLRRAFPESYPEDATEIEGIRVEVADSATMQEMVPALGTSQQAPVVEENQTHETPKQPQASTPQRRFHSVTEFWNATDDAGWSQDQVRDALGGSLGEWLNAKTKELGIHATWDDAYNYLRSKLTN